jgi:hypothetical protein
LLLLSLPVLAGNIVILPALNSAIFWKELNITQSARNKESLSLFGILRDNTPEFMCYKINNINKCKLFSSSSYIKNND